MDFAVGRASIVRDVSMGGKRAMLVRTAELPMASTPPIAQFASLDAVSHDIEFVMMYAASALVLCACLWGGLVLSERAARPGQPRFQFARTLFGVLGIAVSLSMIVSLWTAELVMHPATAIGCVGCAMLSLIGVSSASVRPEQLRELEAAHEETTFAFPRRATANDAAQERKAA